MKRKGKKMKAKGHMSPEYLILVIAVVVAALTVAYLLGGFSVV